MTNKNQIGVVGLGAMGRNLMLNIADHGYSVIGLDKDLSKVDLVKKEKTSKVQVEATVDLVVFTDSLAKPRIIVILVPAGSATDAVLSEVAPRLSPGDLVIDAGNSHFRDTNAREKMMFEKGLHFFGLGVSGGEKGARRGPSLMPGGDRGAFERVRPLLEAIAAKVDGDPCVRYLGPGSAGHYVKMVHNGIEYGIMQLIAETYHIMKTALKYSDLECQETYASWNKSELNSYLLEITATIFTQKDGGTDQLLLNKILGVARQKGTGMWVCQDAMDLQVPIPTIDAALGARDLSSSERDLETATKTLGATETEPTVVDHHIFSDRMRNAYYAGSIICFAQGMSLLQKASATYSYGLDLETVAKIWRGGCIIRAALLEKIMFAFRKEPALSNLMLSPDVAETLVARSGDLRLVIQQAAASGIPVPAMMASLAYFDSYRSAWLPANLIQAQRDFFGAHTYERNDKPGTFHTDWEVQ